MNLQKLVQALPLEIKSGRSELSRPIGGGYAGDLVSDALAHSEAGDLWLTAQVYPNIIEVATLRGLAAVILVGGKEAPPETLRRAEEQKVVVLASREHTFALVQKLSNLGIHGRA